MYDSVDGVGTGYANGTYAGVLYPGAINEFTDVELIPTGNGVKENIIMRRYTTSEISYVLDFSGLSPAPPTPSATRQATPTPWTACSGRSAMPTAQH